MSSDGPSVRSFSLPHPSRIVSLPVLLTLLIGVTLVAEPAPAAQAEHTVCDGPGLVNAGFEDGHLDGLPDCWEPGPIVDAVVVVDAEDSADFQVYGAPNNISVVPHEGSQMLRLGTPKRRNESQTPQPDYVEQTFLSNSDSLRFSFWLLSFEHRGLDRFAFDLSYSDGSDIPGVTFSAGPDGAAPSPGLSVANAGPDAHCDEDELPCSFSIDVGDKQDFLSSGWYVVELSGIPVGEELTLRYEAGGTENSAIPTWAYFDTDPTDPIAKFDVAFAPVPIHGEDPEFDIIDYALEGTVVQLVDQSVDPDGDIVEWAWTVTSPEGDSLTSTAQFPVLVPPQQGTYTVSLQVTDSNGGTSTATSDELVLGDLMPFIEVENADPLVDAVNTEALAGSDLPLDGLYADGGWIDGINGHTQSFTVDDGGVALPVTDLEANTAEEPSLASGEVTATVAIPPGAAGTIDGLFTVDDMDGGTGTDSFAINVVPDDPDSREGVAGNDTLETAASLNSDGSYLSWLLGNDEVDFFELKWRDGQALPANTDLLLSMVPPDGADYDLAIIGTNTEIASLGQQFVGQQFVGQQFVGQQFVGQQFVGQQFVGQQFVGQQFVGQQFVGQQFVGQQFVGQQFVGQQFVGQQFVGQQFVGQQFVGADSIDAPFSGTNYEFNGFQLNALSSIAALDGTTVGSADIPIDELGLQLPTGAALLGFAANSGSARERLLISVPDPGIDVYAVVIRRGNPTTTDPYRLTVRTSSDILSLASAAGVEISTLAGFYGGMDEVQAACTGTALTADAGFQLLHDYAGPGDAQTVFVTQLDRLNALYDPLEVQAMLDALELLAEHDKVRGDIISVPTSAGDFGAWDEDPCNVQAANDVAASVRAQLMPYINDLNVENVVIVGSDNIIPFRRVADTTVIGNESSYALGTFLDPSSPLFHAVDQGYILTQDYYVDRVLTPYEAGALYVPDLAVGRLVETPTEITGIANAFLASDGMLDVSTASVSGYDFFEDHANAVETELDAALGAPNVDKLLSDWTADALRCNWGIDAAGSCATPSFSDHSAHYTHWAGLSAYGFANEIYTDYYTSGEVATAGLDGSFAGHLGVTIGCHAGFPVPDEDVSATGLPFDPSLDFAQAMAQAQAVWVASTGYAIGDDAALGYTEQLMLNYVQQLLGGGSPTAGASLVTAKQDYLSALGTITNYDLKVSVEMTLYGLPQYEIDLPGGAFVGSIETQLTQAVANLTAGPGDTEVETLVLTPDLETIEAKDDNDVSLGFFQTDHAPGGGTSSVVARATVPDRVTALEAVPDLDVHGAILFAGNYKVTPDFDPLIHAPLIEWGFSLKAADEPQVCLPIFWPSPVKLNGVEDQYGIPTQLVSYAGAFECTTDAGEDVLGTYREYSSQTAKVFRSQSTALPTDGDWQAPLIQDVEVVEGQVAGITVSVTASDDSGIAAVYVSRFRDDENAGAAYPGVVSTQFVEPVDQPTSGTFEVDFPDFDINDAYVVYVVDNWGNVATDSSKGYLIRFIDVLAESDDFVPAGVPVTLTGTIFEYDSSEAPLIDPIQYQWSFDNGTTTEGTVDLTDPNVTDIRLNPDGSLSFDVSHTFEPAPPGEVEATLLITDAGGSTGVDTTYLYVCGDPIDVEVDPTAEFPAEQADLIGCDVEITGSGGAQTIAISLYTVGDLTDAELIADISFRLRVGLTTQTSMTQMAYHDEVINGPKTLNVSITGNKITFSFKASDIGKKGQSADTPLIFSAETRGGVPSTGSAGLIDELPDGGGTILYPPVLTGG
jgi:PKD repeat protein